MKKTIKELIKYGKIAGKRGYTPGLSGNISARFGDNVIITTSGSANGFLDEDDFVVMAMLLKEIKNHQAKKCCI